ncbi:unnamed protein product [Didymodactylos carnosus]|uniref:RING-type domain-containing protein n=2 Tax=Didymodactylos carnosus TaxID=1234261 RepID=A0A815B631_9BILA|nr:unnamed protein product [Didymodactylos carnosus]CAF4048681.1 unnamed protein product [Didymodactylos carnosus]
MDMEMANLLVDDRYICGICKKLFIEPLSAGCGHRYCKRCVEGLINSTDQKCLVYNCRQLLLPTEIIFDVGFKREMEAYEK